MAIKNLAAVAKRSKRGTKIYYSIENEAVYTTPKPDRYYVTELLCPCTTKEIGQMIQRWLWS